MTTFEKVRRIIVEQLGVDEGEVTLDASLVDDLSVDSLDIVDLAIAFEEEFGIKLNDNEIERIQLVRDTVDLVNQKLAAKKAAVKK